MHMAERSSSPRLYIPALGPIYDKLSWLAYPLIRFAAGAMLVPHGFAKLFQGGLEGTAAGMARAGLEPAYALAVYIALLEFVGGILLAAGLFTRLVAVLVFAFMMVAAFHVHLPNGFMWTNKGFEYPLFWGMTALAIAFRGGGPLSVDHAIGREL